ncbi:peroxidase 44-like [Neltuma alba]|uniref:peroxidase 44-like n=1 Tax=Neltuma alba TaxID=207710 RepID=UPI0010A4B05C|nr:peroxidase 44-like [Prosopis alba]XP_028774513.1 peroxidase 44-like [Prosopis alba]
MKIANVILIFLFVLPFSFADLRVGFYRTSCPSAETIVRRAVRRHFNRERTITADLLQMHFHDCFVRGCDGSILIDPRGQKGSEKQAGPNINLEGFDLIDEIKAAVEKACPSTVSCADIVTLATRDAVALAGGPRYNVPTGRRDGLVSSPNEVNIPGPSLSVSQAFESFRVKGFSLNEMVTLLGAHTVGFTHCSLVRGRLSSFRNRDPTMDPALDAKLGRICGSAQRPARNDPKIVLDQNTSLVFDNEYYRQVRMRRGVLHIDQQLGVDASSRGIVAGFAANGNSFKRSFAKAMIKMGSLDILVGNAGEIRKHCRAFNNPR